MNNETTCSVSNEERLKKAFAEALSISADDVTDSLAYNECPAWDSIAHMVLVASIDAEFNTMLEMDDILDMSSFGKAKEILGKFGVSFVC